jgi:SAM-dependent methyltransferase
MTSEQLYDTLGATYTATRHTEPRIAAQLWAALGDAGTVLNVGAGTGSYEPPDRDVTAVEPSAVMRAQRPASAARCVAATAERLPFEDQSFNAAMAFATVHHWHDPVAGLREMRTRAKPRGQWRVDVEDVPCWRRGRPPHAGVRFLRMPKDGEARHGDPNPSSTPFPGGLPQNGDRQHHVPQEQQQADHLCRDDQREQRPSPVLGRKMLSLIHRQRQRPPTADALQVHWSIRRRISQHDMP